MRRSELECSKRSTAAIIAFSLIGIVYSAVRMVSPSTKVLASWGAGCCGLLPEPVVVQMVAFAAQHIPADGTRATFIPTFIIATVVVAVPLADLDGSLGFRGNAATSCAGSRRVSRGKYR